LISPIKEHPRFFLGTDSAPHPRHTKETAQGAAAGVFTGPFVLQYLAHALEGFGALDALGPFACEFGRRFYKLVDAESRVAGMDTAAPPRRCNGTVTLVRQPFIVPLEIKYVDDEGTERTIVPYKAGKALLFSLIPS
jgi:dihydroorotase